MPHSINEVRGDFTDILAATRQLQKIGFVYRRMHFDDLEGKDPTTWTFTKSHLQRFQELVDEAAAIRTQQRAWESRAREWGITAPETSQQASKPKQADSTKRR